MKRVLIGGFISLIGNIWALAIIFIASSNLASSWSTPPGRLLTTIAQMDMMVLFVLSIIFVILGIIMMVIEYFRKGN